MIAHPPRKPSQKEISSSHHPFSDAKCEFPKKKRQVNNEKRACGWLGYIGDEISPIYTESRDYLWTMIRIPNKQPVNQYAGKEGFFFWWLRSTFFVQQKRSKPQKFTTSLHRWNTKKFYHGCGNFLIWEPSHTNSKVIHKFQKLRNSGKQYSSMVNSTTSQPKLPTTNTPPKPPTQLPKRPAAFFCSAGFTWRSAYATKDELRNKRSPHPTFCWLLNI